MLLWWWSVDPMMTHSSSSNAGVHTSEPRYVCFTTMFHADAVRSPAPFLSSLQPSRPPLPTVMRAWRESLLGAGGALDVRGARPCGARAPLQGPEPALSTPSYPRLTHRHGRSCGVSSARRCVRACRRACEGSSSGRCRSIARRSPSHDSESVCVCVCDGCACVEGHNKGFPVFVSFRS